MLAKWDSPSRKQIKCVNINVPAKCIHMSKQADYLAVGCSNGEL